VQAGYFRVHELELQVNETPNVIPTFLLSMITVSRSLITQAGTTQGTIDIPLLISEVIYVLGLFSSIMSSGG
jgi:hypothetical protein